MLSSFLRTVPQSQANQTNSMPQVPHKRRSAGNFLYSRQKPKLSDNLTSHLKLIIDSCYVRGLHKSIRADRAGFFVLPVPAIPTAVSAI